MKTIQKDLVFKLLILNMALVILGYALAVISDKASVETMKVVKYAFLLISIMNLIRQNLKLLRLISVYLRDLLLLSLAFFFFALFTEEPQVSVISVLTFLVPMLYVAYSVGYLFIKYAVRDTINVVINAINWVYLLPIISFFVTGGSLSDTNIYYLTNENDGTAFISNHYGWSSTVFLVTGIDLWRNVKLPVWRKSLIMVGCCIAVYLVLISGNRTSWLSLLFVSCIFLVRYKRVTNFQKILLAIIPLFFIVYLLKDPKSALYSRAKKTETQSKKGEVRIKVGKKMMAHFIENPSLFVTGIGMFNKSEVETVTEKKGYHNSYYEVLFGAGFIVFAFFAYLIIIRPLSNYLRFFSTRYLFLAPLMIIPYFESNLTGGQFLFFPWFIMIITMGYSVPFARLRETIRRVEAANLVSIGKNAIQP